MANMTDRHGRELAVGQRVRIQVCVGRYGQTAIRQGTIAEIDDRYCGLTLRTERPFSEDHGRFGVHRRAAGDLVYVPVTPGGYEKFPDFEHGHEKWTEVIGEGCK